MQEKQKKRNRILSLAVCLLMLSALAMPMNVQEASAASNAYMSVQGSREDRMPREKTGKYYLWVDETLNEKTDVWEQYLKSTTSPKKKPKTLAKVVQDGEYLNAYIVSNGKDVFYTKTKNSNRATIYKVSVKGGKSKAIKTIKDAYATNIELYSYYNGKIYFTCNLSLKSLNLATKKIRVERKNFITQSGYGPYLTGFDIPDMKRGDIGSQKMLLYNAKTRKVTKLLTANEAIAAGNTVYFYEWKYPKKGKPTVTVKKCNLSGKKAKTIKTYKADGSIAYFGRKNIYIAVNNGKTIKKVNYKTGKMTTVK